MGPYLIPDLKIDSIPFYLKEEVVKEVSPGWEFGRYEYLPTEEGLPVFDLNSVDSLAVGFHSTGFEGISIPFSPMLNTIFFLLFLLCFLVTAIVYNNEGSAFSTNFRSIFSLKKYTTSAYKEQVTTGEVWGEFYMIFQSVIIFTLILFTFLWDSGYVINSPTGYLFAFVGMFLAIAVLAGLKFLMYRVISSFFLNADIKDWTVRYFRLFELLGLVLFIPVVFLVYLPEYRTIILTIIALVFVISRIIVVIETLNIFVKNKVGTFYFFSYLCGIELAPYFLYYKLVLSIINIAGNNIV